MFLSKTQPPKRIFSALLCALLWVSTKSWTQHGDIFCTITTLLQQHYDHSDTRLLTNSSYVRSSYYPDNFRKTWLRSCGSCHNNFDLEQPRARSYLLHACSHSSLQSHFLTNIFWIIYIDNCEKEPYIYWKQHVQSRFQYISSVKNRNFWVVQLLNLSWIVFIWLYLHVHVLIFFSL